MAIKKGEYHDIKQWWDLGKRHIKSFSIAFSKEKGIKTRAQLSEIEEKIDQRKKQMLTTNGYKSNTRIFFLSKVMGHV